MKKIFIYSVLFSLLACGQNNETEKQTESMDLIDNYTIAFYNVENLFDTINDPKTSDDEFTPQGSKIWDTEKYYTKLNHIEEVLGGIDKEFPLLVGLCEVENKEVLEDLTQDTPLKKANYGIVHYDSPDTRGIDVALLYKKKFFTVEETESLEVRFEQHPYVLTRDILYVRGVLNGEELHFFVNHWSSRRKGEKETEYKRLQAARVLRKKVNEILDKDIKAKILLMGDFNDYPNNNSITRVLKASVQPVTGEFYNLAYKLDKKGDGSHFYNGEWGMLDQMMVSNGWLSARHGNVLRDKKVYVYKDEKVLFNHREFGGIPNKTYSGDTYHGGYSDHLAIYVKMNMRN